MRREADALEAQIDEHRATLERSHVERADLSANSKQLSAQDVAARARETELEAELARLRAAMRRVRDARSPPRRLQERAKA